MTELASVSRTDPRIGCKWKLLLRCSAMHGTNNNFLYQLKVAHVYGAFNLAFGVGSFGK